MLLNFLTEVVVMPKVAVVAPEEITKLGLPVATYRQEVAWLEELHAEVISW